MMSKACLMMRRGSSTWTADSVARWNGQDMTHVVLRTQLEVLTSTYQCSAAVDFLSGMIKFRGYFGSYCPNISIVDC